MAESCSFNDTTKGRFDHYSANRAVDTILDEARRLFLLNCFMISLIVYRLMGQTVELNGRSRTWSHTITHRLDLQWRVFGTAVE